MDPTDIGDTINLFLWCYHKVDSFVYYGKCVDIGWIGLTFGINIYSLLRMNCN